MNRTTAVFQKLFANKKKPFLWSKNEEFNRWRKPKTDPDSILTIFPSTKEKVEKLLEKEERAKEKGPPEIKKKHIYSKLR